MKCEICGSELSFEGMMTLIDLHDEKKFKKVCMFCYIDDPMRYVSEEELKCEYWECREYLKKWDE